MQANMIRKIAEGKDTPLELKPSVFLLYGRFFGYIWQHRFKLIIGSSTIFVLSFYKY